MEGLRPIVKELNTDSSFTLKDAKGLYYLWNMWEGHLWRVTDNWTKGDGLVSIEAVVDNILCNISWVENDAVKVFRTYIKTEHEESWAQVDAGGVVQCRVHPLIQKLIRVAFSHFPVSKVVNQRQSWPRDISR